jgi:hypothetical protein
VGEEVAIRQAGQVSAIPDAKEITALYKLGKAMAASGMFADARQEFQAMTKLVLGRDLGLSATAAMTGIYIFDNKVELSSNLQAQMIRTWLGLGGERYDYSVDEHTSEKCVITIYRVPAGVVYGNLEREGYDRLGTGEFTMEDAKRASLASKAVWKNYPMNMLFARAMSNAIAFHCPEVTGGVRLYAPGEVSQSEDPGARAVSTVGDFANRTEAIQPEATEPPAETITDAQVVDEPALTPEQQAEMDRLDQEFGATIPEDEPPPAEPPPAAEPEPPPAAANEEQLMALQALVQQGLMEIGENETVIQARLRGTGRNETALRNLLKFIENKKQQMEVKP